MNACGHISSRVLIWKQKRTALFFKKTKPRGVWFIREKGGKGRGGDKQGNREWKQKKKNNNVLKKRNGAIASLFLVFFKSLSPKNLGFSVREFQTMGEGERREERQFL